MMRLPWFRYLTPDSVEETVTILAGEGPDAAVVAGGTDLFPNMKRKHQVPHTLVGLRHVNELKQATNGDGLTLGAGLTLTDLTRNPRRILPYLPLKPPPIPLQQVVDGHQRLHTTYHANEHARPNGQRANVTECNLAKRDGHDGCGGC